jgi:hypothetical protein
MGRYLKSLMSRKNKLNNKIMCQDNNAIVPDITMTDITMENTENSSLQSFEFDPSTLAAQITACVSATYNNGQICVKFPVIGNICFNVPLKIPTGATVKVCMQTCGFKFFPPFFKGVKATVYFNNIAIWSGTIWGSC